ncbi:MAG: glucosaminidase domain-containing protein [bacterium]|nr:glucosaminidase domain-containing protein [bacterium]
MKSILKGTILVIGLTFSMIIILLFKPVEKKENNTTVITKSIADNFASSYVDVNNYNVDKIKEEYELNKLVYENMTMSELITMINSSLNSTISGKGELIATYSLEKNVDPIVATAIILHETGCKWTCSNLVKKCNNVGGVKGSPKCNGEYKKYNSLDSGIKKFIDNLSQNYYSKGLNTPELMQKKYAGSSSWATKVNNYIDEIKKTS